MTDDIANAKVDDDNFKDDDDDVYGNLKYKQFNNDQATGQLMMSITVKQLLLFLFLLDTNRQISALFFLFLFKNSPPPSPLITYKNKKKKFNWCFVSDKTDK